MSDQFPKNDTEPQILKVEFPSAYLQMLFNDLIKCIKEKGAPPIYDEIGKTMGDSKGLLARRMKQLYEQGRIVIDEEKMTTRAPCIAKGLGHDETSDAVYLTEDRKAIIKWVKSIVGRTGIGLSINMLAHELGFSNSKIKHHVECLDKNELLRYSQELGTVIATAANGSEPKSNA
ncbi:DNA-binding protein [Providencia stuartii]|uniref:DNA-binding protein n=1 Tax=Providencia stuartii TaxID=588 RepID=UPI000CE670B5|nr:DNA-binding protein [Providencia stuartii]AVE42290.1 DNA-binding protein [Providencia stuartii]